MHIAESVIGQLLWVKPLPQTQVYEDVQKQLTKSEVSQMPQMPRKHMFRGSDDPIVVKERMEVSL